MYDPALGRFHTIDPHSESYASISNYAYVFNNPVKLIDYQGMDPIYPWGQKYDINFYRAEIVNVGGPINYKNNIWTRTDNWIHTGTSQKHLAYKDRSLRTQANWYDGKTDMGGNPFSPDQNFKEHSKKQFGNPKLKDFRNSRYHMSRSSFQNNYNYGWTAGWELAASSNNYTFIDDVYAKNDQFNKVTVNDGIVNKIENYQAGEDGDFSLFSTTTFEERTTSEVETIEYNGVSVDIPANSNIVIERIKYENSDSQRVIYYFK